MKNSYAIKSSIILSSLLFLGCAEKESISIENNGATGETFSELNSKKALNEQRTRKQYVNTQNSSVSKVLELLSDEDIKTHILEGEDLLLPSKKYRVLTIRDLQQFIEMFSNMKLVKEAESERLVKWKLVSHELNPFNKKYKMDLSGEDIKLNEIMKQIGIATGYSVIPKKDVLEDYNKSLNLEFNGETIKEFIDYMSKYSNLYIDIDHKMKTLTLSKFKHTIFDVPVSIPNIDIEKDISSGGGTVSGTGFGGGNISTKTKQQVDIYEELDRYLSTILATDVSVLNAGELNKNTYFIQKGVGKVYVNADPVTMAKVTEVVNNFKSNLEISVNVNVAVYTVDLKDNSSYGINWQLIQNSLSGVLSAGNVSNIMTVADTGATGAALTNAAKTGILGNTVEEGSGIIGGAKNLGNNTAIGAILNMAGDYGKITDIQKFNISTMNNFPTVQVISRKNPYLRSITNEIVANDTGNNTIVTTPEFGEVDSGIFFYINAKTFKDSDTIAINFAPMFNKLEGFETINYGNNESSSQPVTSIQSYNNNIVINDGEQVLITGIITDKKGSGYKGMNPAGGSTPEMLNALTGINSTDNAKQEIFIILSATKEKK